MKRVKLSIKLKITLIFVLMGVLIVLAIGYAAYSLNTHQVESQYERLALSSAQTAAGLINGDSIPRYLSLGKDSEYDESYDALLRLKTAYELEYLYVIVPELDINNAVYVFDIFREGDDPELVMDLGVETGWIDIYDIARALYVTGDSEIMTVVTDGEFGYLSSAYVPVYASDCTTVTAVVGVDISMDRIIGEVRRHTVQILITAVVIIAVFLAVLLIAIDRQIILPIARLSAHMDSFVKNDGEFQETIALSTGDELETMLNSFNKMVGDLRSYIENLASVMAEKERISAELSVAQQIQGGMLPSIFPPFPGRLEFDIFATMRPAKEVGGDFYDFFMLPRNRLCTVIADVSGKGIPAALFMVITKTLIKNQADTSKTPGEILTAVNNKLCETNDADFFVTVFIGILDLATGDFSCTNAGHCMPIISRGGVYSLLELDSGFVLAGLPDYRFETYETVLEPGNRLLLYTDGVTEAQNADEELWGETRLIESLNRPEAAELDPPELLPYLMTCIEDFVDGANQADDITMLSLKLIKFTDN